MAAMKSHLKLKEKLILLEIAASKNISVACASMGVSRKTYYRIKKAYDKGGVEALTEKSRKVFTLKNRVSKKVERAVLKFSLEDPTLGKKKMSRIRITPRISVQYSV